jgi:chemotaxis protein CheX
MTVDHPIVKAFMDALRSTLSTMAMLEVNLKDVREASRLNKTFDFTATMGLAREAGEGLMMITIDGRLARTIVASMLGMGEDEIDGDLLDGVGEVANMVAGAAKTSLSGTPYRFDLSIPAASTGAGNEVSAKNGTPGFSVEGEINGQKLMLGLWMRGT